MRCLLFALPFALLPLAAAEAGEHAHDHEHEEHGSLGAHEHGVVRLDASLDGKSLELEQLLTLFALPATAGCTLASQEIESPLFGNEQHDHDPEHSEVHAHYQLECASPETLKALDLTQLFKTFPATEKIQVQLIGPQGQQGAELSATNTILNF